MTEEDVGHDEVGGDSETDEEEERDPSVGQGRGKGDECQEDSGGRPRFVQAGTWPGD